MDEMKHKSEDSASAKAVSFCGERKVDLKKIWEKIFMEAEKMAEREPQMKTFLREVVLEQQCLAGSMGARLARKLAHEDMSRQELSPLLTGILKDEPSLIMSMAKDLLAIHERDPACYSPLQPLLFFKGFLAISTYRIAHYLWLQGRKDLAMYFQSLSSEVFAVDIHPAAKIGCGILLDHATSFVVGETAIIENDVSILHEVTLGGTGKDTGDRHPIVRSGVLIGAGAKVLGRVEIGHCAKIGAGSVVLTNVAPHKTVAGVPAVVVGEASEESPALEMDQGLDC
jgi:serine O-acetyltransferase